LIVGLLVLLFKAAFDWFMHTELGLAMQATGDNSQMARSLGVNTDRMIVLGLAISNSLVGLSGAIFAQFQGFADINMGTGLIIAGLAAVILGETFIQPKKIAVYTAAVVMGMVMYRLAIAAALNVAIPLPGGETLKIDPLDVKLATAILVLGALWLTRFQNTKSRAS
jgi:putative ABC transport system permease protein